MDETIIKAIESFLNKQKTDDPPYHLLKFIYEKENSVSWDDMLNYFEKRDRTIKEYLAEANRRLLSCDPPLNIHKNKNGLYDYRIYKGKKDVSELFKQDKKTTTSVSEIIRSVKPSNKWTIKEYIVLRILQQNRTGMTLNRIAEKYNNGSDEVEKAKHHVRSILYGSKKKKGLIRRNYVVMKKESYEGVMMQLYVPTEKSFVFLDFDMDSDELGTLQYLIQDKGNTGSFPEVLKELDHYISFLNDVCDEGQLDRNEQFLVTGLRKKGKKYNIELLGDLNKVDYINHPVEFTCRDQNGEEEQLCLKIGMLVYSRDKERLYMIGRAMDEKGNTYEIMDRKMIPYPNRMVDLKSIVSPIRVIEKYQNELYGTQEFQKIFDTMFSVSIEEPMDVEIHFESFGNIYSKLYHLKQARKHGKLERKDDLAFNFSRAVDRTTICYTDTIRGMEDISKYLRFFGSSVHVIRPEKLRQRMIDTIDRTLLEYDLAEKEGFFE